MVKEDALMDTDVTAAHFDLMVRLVYAKEAMDTVPHAL